MPKLISYSAEIYVPDAENQCNVQVDGFVFIGENDTPEEITIKLKKHLGQNSRCILFKEVPVL